VKVFGNSASTIDLSVAGYINVGGYTFNAFADALWIYANWNEGVFYSVDGHIRSQKIYFSWFTSSYYWGHERSHFTATFDEVGPSILTTQVFDT
jgi:hypothetical protein